jgi:hypothetical protein
MDEDEEVPGISGLLNTYADTTHEFNKNNPCPYLMKSELCFLSGKICLYDDPTYRICPTYATGVAKQLPGPNGVVPTESPVGSLRDLLGDTQPIEGPVKALFKS